MRKAKLSVHIADVKKVMPSLSVEVSASSIDVLFLDPGPQRGRYPAFTQEGHGTASNQGANYDRQSSQY
jgi:hypothetical protein